MQRAVLVHIFGDVFAEHFIGACTLSALHLLIRLRLSMLDVGKQVFGVKPQCDIVAF